MSVLIHIYLIYLVFLSLLIISTVVIMKYMLKIFLVLTNITGNGGHKICLTMLTHHLLELCLSISLNTVVYH